MNVGLAHQLHPCIGNRKIVGPIGVGQIGSLKRSRELNLHLVGGVDLLSLGLSSQTLALPPRRLFEA